MFQKLVDEWLSLERNKEADDIGMFEAAVLYDFAHWLDTRAATLRAPVRAEQKCPSCEGKGVVTNIVLGEHTCTWCDGTGISNRSAGG